MPKGQKGSQRPSDVVLLELLEAAGSSTKLAELKGWPVRTTRRWIKSAREGKSKKATIRAPKPKPASEPEEPPKLPDWNDTTAVRAFLLQRFATQACGHDAAAVSAAKALGQLTGADKPGTSSEGDSGGLSPQDARHIRAVRRRMARWYRSAIMMQLARREENPPEDPEARARLDRLHELYFAAANARTGALARVDLVTHLRAWGDELFS